MADRIKSLAKRSGSKMSISKGSVNHIGAAPITYKIDIFISYVDAIKSSGEFCVSWERRGKSLSTASVKVKDNKAVFRESLSMETTLFRKSSPKGGAGGKGAADGDFKFDEKIAKFALRKGNAEGKAIGKMHLNLAEHVKGTTGTVFADLKLSNGSVVVTKIESTLLYMGRKAKKGGADGDSEICSEMSEMDHGMENDSIFGDDADTDDLGDIDLMIEEAGPVSSSKSKASNAKNSDKSSGSKDGAVGKMDSRDDKGKESSKNAKRSNLRKDSSVGDDAREERGKDSPKSAKKSKGKEEAGLTESPSLRDKVRSKLKKEKLGAKKEKGVADSSPKTPSGSKAVAKTDPGALKPSADTAELRKAITGLTAENKRLQTSRQAMMEEIEELRAELESCEQALEEVSGDAPPASGKSSNGGGNTEAQLRAEKKELQATVKELEGQVEGLLDELDGSDREDQSSRKEFSQEDYKRQIVDLELALKREPQYLDVVNELKVTKMTLALANMEKEQAIFALRKFEAAHAKGEVTSPMSAASDSPEGEQSKPWGGVFG